MTAIPTTLWPRLMAAVYDLFLIVTILFVGTFLVLPFTGGEAIPLHLSFGSILYRLYLLGLVGGFYVWFWTHGGQTLGMRSWRLKAVTPDGLALSWQQSALRFLIAVPSWLSVIGILWCLVDSEKRALHDLISKTCLVRLEKATKAK